MEILFHLLKYFFSLRQEEAAKNDPAKILENQKRKTTKKNGECITIILEKVCQMLDVKDGFNLSLFEVYKHVISSIMYSPINIDMEVSRDGDAELFEELLADNGSELILSDLALPDKQYGKKSESLRPFMFNMQRDMIEKVGRYMNEILLYYDAEGQYTTFERKKDFFKNDGSKIDDSDDLSYDDG